MIAFFVFKSVMVNNIIYYIKYSIHNTTYAIAKYVMLILDKKLPKVTFNGSILVECAPFLFLFLLFCIYYFSLSSLVQTMANRE